MYLAVLLGVMVLPEMYFGFGFYITSCTFPYRVFFPWFTADTVHASAFGGVLVSSPIVYVVTLDLEVDSGHYSSRPWSQTATCRCLRRLRSAAGI